MPTALVCEKNTELQKILIQTFKGINFETVTPSNQEEALNYLETEDFEVVILGSEFFKESNGDNKIMKYLSNFPMYRRRNTMVVLIGSDLKTANRLQAFSKGVDLVINPKDLGSFLPIFRRAYSEFLSKFKKFKELLNR